MPATEIANISTSQGPPVYVAIEPTNGRKQLHPREVFRPAIVSSAASIILVHNHPSGDPEPSEEDLAITRRLVQVGELHGIGVLDHVILAKRGGFVSLRARGLL